MSCRYFSARLAAGKKTGTAEDYEGGRTASDIVQYGEEEYMKNLPPPEVLQAYSSGAMSNCTDKQICFMGYLPLLQDSGKDGRNAFIKIMQDVADTYKRRPYGWVWVEGTTQPSLEAAYRVVDYPALVAVNAKKMRSVSICAICVRVRMRVCVRVRVRVRVSVGVRVSVIVRVIV
jgi:protein disulfide-isomerase A6